MRQRRKRSRPARSSRFLTSSSRTSCRNCSTFASLTSTRLSSAWSVFRLRSGGNRFAYLSSRRSAFKLTLLRTVTRNSVVCSGTLRTVFGTIVRALHSICFDGEANSLPVQMPRDRSTRKSKERCRRCASFRLLGRLETKRRTHFLEASEDGVDRDFRRSPLCIPVVDVQLPVGIEPRFQERIQTRTAV